MLSRRPRTRSSRPLRLRQVVTVLLVGVALLLTGACQVQVEVDAVVDSNGAGTVTVSVGLDEGAKARIGDLETELQLQDLTASGWTVSPPETGPDTITWIRATKPFSSPAQLESVMAEIAGSDVLFRDVAFERVETDDDITYRVTGQVDLTKGLATFADPEVAAQLGGDPFGGNVAAIEAEEGRPISDMVTFEVSASVAGGPATTVRPTLTDAAPVPISVSTVEVKPASPLIRIAIGAAIVTGLVIVIVALVGVRRRVADRR